MYNIQYVFIQLLVHETIILKILRKLYLFCTQSLIKLPYRISVDFFYIFGGFGIKLQVESFTSNLWLMLHIINHSCFNGTIFVQS